MFFLYFSYHKKLLFEKISFLIIILNIMKISKSARIFIGFFSIFTLLSAVSCKKDKKLAVEDAAVSIPAANEPAKLKKLDDETKTYLNGKNVILILGYGYNDEASIQKITENLTENFGVQTENNDGLVSIFVYPNDFMSSGKARVSSLVDLLEDKTPAGIIILGAPDGMYIALSKLQDNAENGKLSYPVFSFLSQDDVLGAEATADFVLDYAHKSDELGAEGEVTDFIPDFDLFSLLDSSILEMIKLREPLKSDENLETFVKNLFDGKKNVAHYVDGETGLQAINHFIFD